MLANYFYVPVYYLFILLRCQSSISKFSLQFRHIALCALVGVDENFVISPSLCIICQTRRRKHKTYRKFTSL
jgi:hypothetical protein